MNYLDVKDALTQALDGFYKWDKDLLKINISERAMAHRLAVYLERRFRGYHIDCEYNKRHDVSAAGVTETPDKEVPEKGKVYPDIIVHKRGPNTSKNILAVELKKSSNKIGRDSDVKKLKGYTKRTGKFQYDFGVFIELSVRKRNNSRENFAKCEWYENGKKKTDVEPNPCMC